MANITNYNDFFLFENNSKSEHPMVYKLKNHSQYKEITKNDPALSHLVWDLKSENCWNAYMGKNDNQAFCIAKLGGKKVIGGFVNKKGSVTVCIDEKNHLVDPAELEDAIKNEE